MSQQVPGTPRSGRCSLSRRRLLAATVAGALSASTLTGLWEAERIETTWHRRGLPGLSATATRLRVAHLSDLHRGPLVSEGMIQRAAETAQVAGPDLVLVTGDFVSVRADYAASCARALTALRAPLGVWGVRGNHDLWTDDVARLERELESVGVRMLTNRSSLLKNGVWLVGLDDRLAGLPDPAAAFANVPLGAPVLAMAHHPRTFDDLPPRPMSLHAGHLHGGQINFPGRRAMMHRMSGYAWGWYRRGAAAMYVSRGIGLTFLPVRLLARPEVAIVDYLPAPMGEVTAPAGRDRRRPETA